MSSAGSPNPDPNQLPTAADMKQPTNKVAGGNQATTTQVDALPRSHAGQEPAPLEAPAKYFGSYELLHEVARGGMGVVYRAKQVSLNRVVALKMILAGKLADADDLQRFWTEAEAAARLQHPNIVAVYEVGAVEGQHFFSMEFIEGSSLAQRLARGPLPGRKTARYVRLIARAVHYAHTQGILHRDLKPSNIMIDSLDEPHITDFGLAKRMGGSSGQTRTGTVLGTPSYMAPEQAAGRSRELGPACDIYGLGAVLYETITGRPPFYAETPMDTVMQVLHNDPVPPRLLNPNIDHDLETICLKCLEKEPALRYPSAEALADDLQRYLDGDQITARSFNVIDRLARTLDRSQHAVAFHTWSSMVFIMAVVIFIGHLGVWALLQWSTPRGLVTLCRGLEFFVLAVLFLVNRRGRRLLPTSAAERELWTIWIGFLIAYAAINVATRFLTRLDIIEQGQGSPDRWGELILYPFSAIVSGLAFFIMGCNYWGRCYAFGLLFIAVGVLMPFHLEGAPLAFGFLWSGTLMALGMHLHTLGIKAAQEQANASPLASTPTDNDHSRSPYTQP